MGRSIGVVLAAVALAAGAARGDAPEGRVTVPEGRVTVDDGKLEILSAPVKVGVRVDLPEGWYRVEEAGPEDGRVGSFAIVSTDAFAASSGAAVAAAGATEPPEEAPPAAAPKAPPKGACRAERTAYLKELLRGRGIDLDDPEAVLAGIEGDGFAPGSATAWLALSGDALQPLAWTPELRARAVALARCVRGR